MEFIAKTKELPVGLAGLALGLGGIGTVLGTELHPSLAYITGLIAGFILLMLAIKKFAHPRVIINEIKHPVAGSFMPAFDMALMIVAALIASHHLLLGQVLWYIAIILHIIFASSFFYHRAKDIDMNHMLPSWFVPPIGIVVACVTSAHMNSILITHIIFYVGFAFYVIMLPMMMYRLIFGDRISDAQLPAFAVMGAPASLCLAGYLTAFQNPNHVIVGILLALALMMTSLVYLSMIRINHRRIPFTPIYASYTFPLAISATAVLKYSYFVGLDSVEGQFWHKLGLIEMSLATIVIVWVAVMMARFVWKNIFVK